MIDRLACRFKATWPEGERPVRESFHAVAVEGGKPPPLPPTEVLRLHAEHETREPSPGTLDALRLARARRLPSLYDPSGVEFWQTTPIYLDHGIEGVRLEIGRGLVPDRDGNVFSMLGWIHPSYAAVARQRGFVSPGMLIEACEIAQFGGSEVLMVSGATLMELSAVAEPSRAGTTLSVWPPRPVPSPDWEALLTAESAFEISEFGPFRMAFSAPLTTAV